MTKETRQTKRLFTGQRWRHNRGERGVDGQQRLNATIPGRQGQAIVIQYTTIRFPLGMGKITSRSHFINKLQTLSESSESSTNRQFVWLHPRY